MTGTQPLDDDRVAEFIRLVGDPCPQCGPWIVRLIILGLTVGTVGFITAFGVVMEGVTELLDHG